MKTQQTPFKTRISLERKGKILSAKKTKWPTKKGNRKPDRKANAGSVTMLMEFSHSRDLELGEQGTKPPQGGELGLRYPWKPKNFVDAPWNDGLEKKKFYLPTKEDNTERINLYTVFLLNWDFFDIKSPLMLQRNIQRRNIMNN